MNTSRTVVAVSSMVLAALAAGGCTYKVAFHDQDTSWHYAIQTRKYDAALVAVIDQNTLAKTVSIRSAMAGAAQRWDAEPGLMLKQVADVELPQMFAQYSSATVPPPPKADGQRLVLEMSVSKYTFADFGAEVEIRALAYDSLRNPLLDKTYRGRGEGQGGKMFAAGAFGMKSAVRQSSLDAYKQVFAALRGDLARALDSRVPPA